MQDAATWPASYTRDVIVIGASAGGLNPLQRILRDLPADLPAMVFVVMHMGTSSHLAEILQRGSELPVRRAENGGIASPGHVYVAVPGLHLLLHENHILLRRGPRENLSRPAVDALFRSAACSFGARVIGVVLSGALNDGTAGLIAIQQCGGIAVVQDPREAAVPGMPESAIRVVDVDHVAPAEALGGLLARLAREPAGETPDIPDRIRLETAIAAQEPDGMDTNDRLGKPSRFTCPECHGTMWEINDASRLRYRCHVGHAYTAETMLDARTTGAEDLLWSLMRAHQERAALARCMAADETERGVPGLAEELLTRAGLYDEDAATIGRLLKDHVAALGAIDVANRAGGI